MFLLVLNIKHQIAFLIKAYFRFYFNNYKISLLQDARGLEHYKSI